MISKKKTFSRAYVGAGDLRHRITLQRKALTPPAGDSADFQELYTDLVKVFAAIETVNPKQPLGDVNVDELPTHRFWIRYIKEIDTDCWVLHEGQRYPILKVENKDSRNEWTILHCNEKGRTTVEAAKW